MPFQIILKSSVLANISSSNYWAISYYYVFIGACYTVCKLTVIFPTLSLKNTLLVLCHFGTSCSMFQAIAKFLFYHLVVVIDIH